MRIMMINTLYIPIVVGGAEKSVSLLAEALVRSGDEVCIVSLHPGEEHSVEEINGVRVYRLPLYNRYWPFSRVAKPSQIDRLLWHIGEFWNGRAAKDVAAILDQEKPDVVHTNNILGFSVAVWKEVRRRKIRLVHTMRDYYLLCCRSNLFQNGKLCERRCADCKALTANRPAFCQSVDALVGVSEYMLESHLRRGYFKGVPSSVIYNIADTTMSAFRSPVPSGDTSLTFGFIGNLEEKKGIETVLEATTRLSSSNWRLRLAGAGLDEYVTGLKRRFTDPRIEWVGFVKATAFYSSIDVNIVSSIWPEPLPRTLIETFASGRSALCAISGGTPEIVRMGKVVETYPPRDPFTLAALMDKAIADPARWRDGGFVDAGAANVFTEKTITEQYRRVYAGSAATGVVTD
jgi:glycosyltransferase involved in cell wall biosynthesis